MKIDNGKRIQVEAADFSGIAGFSIGKDGEQIAYRPNKAGRLRPGQRISVDGEERRVAAVSPSDFTASMVVVSLHPKGA